ncbi:MAG: hypothetical protein MUC52_01755 [Candidatus Omnitrophica bacterium]|jgi:Zn finger protein HypA/HybF involved in hydrogenase expression|nr:hypothetical protein [Candidatus Omnitrophota bacterium]
MKRFLFYLIRWQLSTPILWLVVKQLGVGIWSTVIANLIGGAIFFWVDRFIFTSAVFEVWHVKEKGRCDNCGKEAALWRLVRAKDYDRTDAKPVFLCPRCSKEKLARLAEKGVKVSQKF